jgi:hypothetical protein
VRWQREHKHTLQRLAQDQKFEQRPVPTFAQLRERLVERQRDRARTAVQQIVASLVGYAMRRRFATIRYDDTDHSFCEQFPWFMLRERIATVCNEVRIRFEHTGASARRTKNRRKRSPSRKRCFIIYWATGTPSAITGLLWFPEIRMWLIQ